ncbi:MAG TPA: RseA family anti-sigma factor, partial [Planctomycetaceae bacterium]
MTNGRPSPDDLLSAYHDGELSPAEREAAERLLEESADARAELEDYRALSELLRGQPSEHAPAGLHAAVMRRIERESAAAPAKPVPAPVASRRLRRGLFALAGGLTAVAGVLLAVNLSNDRFGPQRGDRPAGGAAMSEAVPTAAPALAESVAPMALDSAPRGFEVRDAAPAGDLPDDGVESAAAEMAGAEARPPEEVSPGDVYRYLEQNAEGEVVVVQATVVDVRRAMRHFQVLLQRNEIPTVPVDFDAAASAGLPAASDRGLALYVESDPSQINEALRQLEAEPGGFLGFQVRGVLPTPPAGAGVEGEMRLSAGDAAQPSRSETPAAGRASRQGEGDETRAESVAEQEDLVRPQARGSVPAERFGR